VTTQTKATTTVAAGSRPTGATTATSPGELVFSGADLWDANRAAEYLGVTKDWLYNVVERGGIKSVKAGRMLRFDPAWLREYLVRDTCP
jgi:excisionase family DNA binding protein